MNKILIWDLPTRLFHGGFTLLLLTSIVLALAADEHGSWFQGHMLAGLGAAGLVLLRVVSGLVGSRYARFGSFPVGPGETLRYAVGVISGKARRYAGHNPGSALVALAMFGLVAALAFTGLGFGGREVGELHEALAYALMAFIGLHLAGLVVHTLRHRENIAVSMLTGRKSGQPEEGIVSAQPAWGLAFLLAGSAWVGGLFAGHDSRAGTTRLPLIGTVIQLGEQEERGSQESKAKGPRDRRHHDDD